MALSDREKLDVLLKEVMKKLADDLEKSILVTPNLSKPIGVGLVIPGKEQFVAILEYSQSSDGNSSLKIGVRKRDDDRMFCNYDFFENHKEFLNYVRIPSCDYSELCDQIMALYEKVESYY